MKRRQFIQAAGAFSVQTVLCGSLGPLLTLSEARAASGLPLDSLTATLDPQQATLLLATSPKAPSYDVSFSLRQQLSPQLRILVHHPAAVQASIKWAIKNDIEFAIRSGGHSYEGFSQSKSLVIDVRGLDQIQVDSKNNLVTVGSGAPLGEVYKALAPHNLAIPAGSCFPVGVAGHTLGGGFGLLAREYGLACDNVESMEIVDATGQLRRVSASEDSDLFWALCGGGNGSLVVVTEFVFRTHTVAHVVTFGLTWQSSMRQALSIVQGWQDWLADAPPDLTGTLHLEKGESSDLLRVHFAGFSTSSETSTINELRRWQNVVGTAPHQNSRTRLFIDAATIFDGSTHGYESVYMKAKSDYIREPLSEAGIRTLLQGIQNAPTPIVALADTYGGKINDLPREATAFVHRGDTRYLFQYFSQWSEANETSRHLQALQNFYAPLRPFVSGECYVNYCDLDLPNYAQAYWAENLPRLKAIKSKVDPLNVFKHAQSIPL